MTIKMIDVRNDKPELKDLLKLVAQGEEIIFTDDDTPIARLVSCRQRIPGLHRGAIIVSARLSMSRYQMTFGWVRNETAA